jgi:signal transduction histidine kinase
VPEEDRVRTLVDAGIALSSELSLDALLEKLVQSAAELTGARYVALGVIDRGGRELERFVTHGIDPETHAAIGELPRGRGILGVLIREAQSLRLHDLTEDSRSVGFPPSHPLMRTFLGVPVLLRGVAYGNLYLTEKAGGADFTEEDEELVTLLASQAAVAIENARLYESATRWLRQLESLNEVGNALSAELQLSPLLQLVANRLRELIGARLVIVALPAGTDTLRIETVAGEGAESLVGTELDRTNSKHARVLDRRRAERVDSVLDDPEIDQEVARRIGARTGLYVPLLAQDRTLGVIGLHDKIGGDPRFTEDDQRVAQLFADRAAVAVELSERVARESLARVVAAQELERKRLARELHDETGQALTSVLLGLKAVEDAKSSGEATTAAADVRALVVQTLQNVRRLAVELRPKALDDFGLVPALERLAETFAQQSGVDVDLEAAIEEERLPPEIETALYRIVQEALTNVAKHSGAQRVSVLLTRKNGSVTAVIEDDGKGFEVGGTDGAGLGLVGMKERLGLLNGRFQVESTEGAGTTIVAEVPVR